MDILSKNGCFISYCYFTVGQNYLLEEKLLFSEGHRGVTEYLRTGSCK